MRRRGPVPPDEEPEGLPELRDPYAAAADRMAERREAEQVAEAPDVLLARPRRNIGRKLFAGVAILLIIRQVGVARQAPPPSLAPNCEQPSFALAADSVKQARPVNYTIVGPADRLYVLGFDTATFVPDDAGGWDAVPLRGNEDSYLVPAPAKRMPKCRRTGFFAVPVPAGEHVVTLFELTGTGAVEVQRAKITVTEPDDAPK